MTFAILAENKKITMRKVFIVCYLLFAYHFLYSNSFSTRSFAKKEYNAANQNWSASTTNKGYVYFANNLGLLEFDGITWELYPAPNGSIIRTVKIDSAGTIFTGGYRELGYWTKDMNNRLTYQSLTNKIKNQFSINEEFWEIHITKKHVVFHSFSGLFIYNGNKIYKLETSGFLNYSARIEDDVFVVEQDRGIFKLNGDSLTAFFISDFFHGKAIRFIDRMHNRRNLLIGTELHGFYVLNTATNEIKPWAENLSNYFAQKKINKAAYVDHGNLLVGTILDGISMLNANGKLLWKANTASGLKSNTVLGICSDKFNNIWLALDKGINYISIKNENAVQFINNDYIGSLYSIAKYNNQLYFGTNQGLYQTKQAAYNYQLIENTQDQVYDCKVIDNVMFIGHNTGTFLLSGNEVDKISDFSGGYSITSYPFDTDYLIQSTYSNLVVYSKKTGQWKLSHSIAGFNNLIRFIEFDHMNNLWASHLYKGVYKLNISENIDSVISIKNYINNVSFKDVNNSINVFKIENRIVFTTKQKLYTYDDLADSIVSYELLNSQLGKYATANRIIKGYNHHYWFISEHGIACYKIHDNQCTLKKEFPLSLFGNSLIENYENLTAINEYEAYLCLENGYAIISTHEDSSSNEILLNTPLLKELYLQNHHGKTTKILEPPTNLKIPFIKNSIRARYAFPLFSTNKVSYQYMLEGLDKKWSDKMDKPIFDIERIPQGEYNLKVRAVNEWGQVSPESIIKLRIKPPWFKSWPAILIFFLLFFLTAYKYRQYTIKKVKMVEIRKQKEKEKELIELRNDKLQTELSYKSQQLASSTMGIIKKNEFLISLKSKITKQKEHLGTRYPEKYYLRVIQAIDENIGGKDDWKLFETNFEQAHESFMLNLKSKYSDLTPSDLRLCAYLRINLTSKDIAPLLGITIRGVENHRYRLRKKFGLNANQSLTDFILSFKK